ncbi:hypothetical protein TNCV_4478331 [Trichonephila clavipes]|nr:hypothetical protein TNCV_4478331 [Trichonephila clavipes]
MEFWISTRTDCFAKKREERLFTCWPDRDGENTRSLLEDLVMRRNCVVPTPSRETTTRRLHNANVSTLNPDFSLQKSLPIEKTLSTAALVPGCPSGIAVRDADSGDFGPGFESQRRHGSKPSSLKSSSEVGGMGREVGDLPNWDGTEQIRTVTRMVLKCKNLALHYD